MLAFVLPTQSGRKSVKSVLWVSADGLRVVDDKTKVSWNWGGGGARLYFPHTASHQSEALATVASLGGQQGWKGSRKSSSEQAWSLLLSLELSLLFFYRYFISLQNVEKKRETFKSIPSFNKLTPNMFQSYTFFILNLHPQLDSNFQVDSIMLDIVIITTTYHITVRAEEHTWCGSPPMGSSVSCPPTGPDCGPDD